jgi:hypothetical protein
MSTIALSQVSVVHFDQGDKNVQFFLLALLLCPFREFYFVVEPLRELHDTENDAIGKYLLCPCGDFGRKIMFDIFPGFLKKKISFNFSKFILEILQIKN